MGLYFLVEICNQISCDGKSVNFVAVKKHSCHVWAGCGSPDFIWTLMANRRPFPVPLLEHPSTRSLADQNLLLRSTGASIPKSYDGEFIASFQHFIDYPPEDVHSWSGISIVSQDRVRVSPTDDRAYDRVHV